MFITFNTLLILNFSYNYSNLAKTNPSSRGLAVG